MDLKSLTVDSIQIKPFAAACSCSGCGCGCGSSIGGGKG